MRQRVNLRAFPSRCCLSTEPLTSHASNGVDSAQNDLTIAEFGSRGREVGIEIN